MHGSATPRLRMLIGWALLLSGGCAEVGPVNAQRDPAPDGTVPSPAPDGEQTRPFDPTCVAPGFSAEAFLPPRVKCRWDRRDVLSTPMVADLDGDGSAEIVFVALDDPPPYEGHLVALRGADCSEVFDQPTDLLDRGQLAIADLDADGRAEIVGVGTDARPRVFDSVGRLLATAPHPAPIAVPQPFEVRPSVSDGGAAIADLDGSAPPEIVYGGLVLRFRDGELELVQRAEIAGAYWGALTAVADVDLDGRPELVVGHRILDGLSGRDKTPAAAHAFEPGYPAVAQFDPRTVVPEIVLVSSLERLRVIRVYDPLTGRVVFGPFEAAPADAHWGGPPTVADFDGDGAPEIGVSGYSRYTVYDPGCAGDPLPASCEADGVRWSRAILDQSSGATGSSVFDFNGDGRDEVVHRDECWFRVADGRSGALRFARFFPSGTGIELPVIADVDADGHAEVVLSGAAFPFDPSTYCAAEPEAGLPVGENTGGIVVLEDPEDRWMPSRAVWNQHTYHITNIDDDLTVPAKEQPSWEGDNSYRKNVQGSALPTSPLPAPDLTAAAARPIDNVACGTRWWVGARICNRGAVGVAAGVPGTFYQGDPTHGAAAICTAWTRHPLEPGACEVVSCAWEQAPSTTVDLWFVADDLAGQGSEPECHEDNNGLQLRGVNCEGTPVID